MIGCSRRERFGFTQYDISFLGYVILSTTMRLLDTP